MSLSHFIDTAKTKKRAQHLNCLILLVVQVATASLSSPNAFTGNRRNANILGSGVPE